MSREAPLKAEKDFTETLDEQLPQIEQLSRSDYKSAVDKLLLLEKQTRQASDLASCKRIMITLMDLLASKKDWSLLNEQILLLSKKQGQLKDSVRVMIQQAISHLDEIQDLETKIQTIETIRTVTENKIFVEIERARVTRILSDILLEKKNDLDKACDVLCELQVETYGSLELSEKIEFILRQMTLSNKRGDYQMSKMLSRKILVRSLEKFADQKLEYYRLMIDIALSEDDYINLVKYHLAIYDVPKIKGDSSESLEALRQIVYFSILSPYSNLQNDLISRVKIDKNVDKLPTEKEILKLFTSDELINWKQLEAQFGNYLFKDTTFDQSTEKGKLHYKDLQKRVIEHNLRIVSKYYSSIRLERLCELLQLEQQDVELNIIELVNNGVIYAKINRPLKIASFIKPKNENEYLNEWSSNIDQLLSSIETVEHLITKEEMMYAAKVK
ncbi:hypothetical protein KL930_001969 [Ogataea haglerorum]|uniref:uncharacterized protein n=1 Tax=Ogataea haglerorum TaxID=1937702 RepID=UPI001C8A6ED6|nr:uncharacterized protein KL911_001910 [Ogataea haglerorum]KAG7699399.1 hypothetical protein KL951_001116 [Ogataea haglerorum]KAG7708529.1 hypothetical protein KL914_002255 [Ogataea haglerorum]KAG7710442.1 hypothetical protein KL950_001355 [Ogataea haglerorum]KAG7721066.1 hypothetical protein KL913_000802 [Ogataea haglerorum]KAG7721820.1 hypothetical protein KL949_000798 [Ogataea haglerorum]